MPLPPHPCGLDSEGHKHDTLGSAGIKVEPVLLVEPDGESVARGGGRPGDNVGRRLEGTDDRDIPGCIQLKLNG